MTDLKRKNDDQGKLYKADARGEIAGVCIGLADFFNIDVTLIRIAFVLLALSGGPGLIAYIVLAIVMPDEQRVYPERYAGNTYLRNDEYV
jgi:phage shock protein C